jgi:hypothetical protein
MSHRFASAEAREVSSRTTNGSINHLGDLRFRALLPEADWNTLPLAVRRRFSKRVADGRTVVYVGEVLDTWMSPAGWLLAQAARLIGAPLPTARDAHVPSVVTVTEDMATGGQIWTRLYARRNGFPQVIHSAKKFSGPTGLEEYVGYGVGMIMRIGVEARVLCFRSDGYFLAFGRWRFRLPAWATPGALCASHEDLGDGRFIYRLEVVHPRLGLLIRQSAAFTEAAP